MSETRAATWLTVGAALCTWGMPLAAGAAGIKATIDCNEAQVGDELTLEIEVEGGGATPQLGDTSAFQVLASPPRTEMRIIGSTFFRGVVYTYVFVPQRPGTFTIGPITVQTGNQVLRSEPITVRVVGDERQKSADRDLFLTTELSSPQPYVGEQVIFTLRFFQRVRLAGAQLAPLELGGFSVRDLGKEKSYQSVINGISYDVTEIRRALFPQEVGALRLPQAVVTAEVIANRRRRPDPFGMDSPFDDMFGRTQTQTRRVYSAPIDVTVRALPAPPPAFSGAVGSYDVHASLSNAKPQVGESTTLTVTVNGTGAGTFAEPAVTGLERFKVYDDKPVANEEVRADGVHVSKRFVKALVPVEPGEITIPPVRLVYFDPAAGTYKTALSDSLQVHARPSDAREELRLTQVASTASGKVAVKVLADDILPIYTKLDALSPQDATAAEPLLLGGGVLAPAIGFFALFTARRRRERLAGDTALRRRQAALRNAKRALATIRETGSEAAEPASRVLRTYIGDRCDLEGGALTPVEAAHELTKISAAQELIDCVRLFLERCEAATYGALPSDGVADPVSDVQKLLKELERLP